MPKTQTNWEYKVYLHDCYHRSDAEPSSSDEELNAIVSAGWDVWKVCGAGASEGDITAIFTLRRVKE
jgi:hypothetical protein